MAVINGDNRGCEEIPALDFVTVTGNEDFELLWMEFNRLDQSFVVLNKFERNSQRNLMP